MNVCIVEDSVHIQERLKNMIEQFPEIHVSSIAGDLATATRLILKNNEYVEDTEEVQAVILDTQLPDGNSLGLLKTIKYRLFKLIVRANGPFENKICVIINTDILL